MTDTVSALSKGRTVAGSGHEPRGCHPAAVTTHTATGSARRPRWRRTPSINAPSRVSSIACSATSNRQAAWAPASCAGCAGRRPIRPTRSRRRRAPGGPPGRTPLPIRRSGPPWCRGSGTASRQTGRTRSIPVPSGRRMMAVPARRPPILPVRMPALPRWLPALPRWLPASPGRRTPGRPTLMTTKGSAAPDVVPSGRGGRARTGTERCGRRPGRVGANARPAGGAEQ